MDFCEFSLGTIPLFLGLHLSVNISNRYCATNEKWNAHCTLQSHTYVYVYTSKEKIRTQQKKKEYKNREQKNKRIEYDGTTAAQCVQAWSLTRLD